MFCRLEYYQNSSTKLGRAQYPGLFLFKFRVLKGVRVVLSTDTFNWNIHCMLARYYCKEQSQLTGGTVETATCGAFRQEVLSE
jgi:hypothetical protein